ncbi:hypothetical protein [Paenibacillus daejeonensis]|uniref:hypothetical protein n=1 Tax=Paenibacillus daejeonensis TaxID=135193 RepID=UPI000366AD38|nr:hypothetical protein [Paenibacillus daejeonensis]
MSRKKTAWLLAVTHLVLLAFVFVWLIMAGAAAMGFTSEAVFKQAFTWGLLAYLLTYPVVLLLGIVMGWVSFARNRHRAALLWQLSPLVWVVSATVLLVVLNWS